MDASESTLISYLCVALQIMDTLAEIQERHDVVRDVERKLLELQQVYYLSVVF